MTCGWQRRQYGSCTRTSPVRCEARMALPAISARSAAAVSIWPRWRRSAWMRASNGVSEPRAASVASAPVTRAAWNAVSASNNPASAIAVENCVPLSSASPSFGPSTMGAIPAAARASDAGTRPAGEKTSPTPSIAAARCASGARSPDAPTEPCDGTTGMIPAASIRSRNSSVSRRTPEAPCAMEASLSASINRATGSGIGPPMPPACERTRLRCNVSRSAVSMRTLASLPKPVLMP